MKKALSRYKILGIVCIVIGAVGYFTIADELRHYGELIGVSTILVSGIIFFAAGSKTLTLKNFSIQWIAILLLISIPISGIILDNMPLGISLGFLIGVILAYVLGKRKQNTNREE